MFKFLVLLVCLTLGGQTFSKESYREFKKADQILVLENRVHSLESEVHQLREEINQIRHVLQNQQSTIKVIVPAPSQPSVKKWVCAVTSSFDKTYTGSGITEIDARSKALKSCQEKENGVFCKEENLRCDSAE